MEGDKLREILFRGKAVVSGQWHYGFFCEKGYNVDYPVIIPHCDDGISDLDWVVDPNTVCQYTGLTDKNGKMIFEGDICKCNGVSGLSFEIVWDGDFCCFVWRDASGRDGFWRSMCGYAEVIGNIHDNPELLEG